ncbi:MAG: class 1 fructose-bisphosphatase [Chitinophagales bacterium]|nr:class 1 fructose-bisphosphatase [Chitinophagales bacterium]
MSKGISLSKYLEQNTNEQLAEVIEAIAQGTVAINEKVRVAGLSDIVGVAGTTNVQGETVQKLDLLANDIIIEYLQKGNACAALVSEETDAVLPLKANGSYVVAIDPLDGSSNIDIAAPIGTIFAIWKRKSQGEVNDSDFLQKGKELAAAGYVLFGSSTILMLSVGNGTDAFTLSAEGKYLLSHPKLNIKKEGNIYSVNQGNMFKYDERIIDFINWCDACNAAPNRPFGLRYIGSMVGDLHRTILKGGIFFYPANKGEKKGKLRLLYECIPMSFLVTQAGGASSNGEIPILEIQPEEIHERTAIFIGSEKTVEQCLQIIQQKVSA